MRMKVGSLPWHPPASGSEGATATSPGPPPAHLVTQGLVGRVEQHQGLQHISPVVEGPLTCREPRADTHPPQNDGAAPQFGLVPWGWDWEGDTMTHGSRASACPLPPRKRDSHRPNPGHRGGQQIR